MTEVAGEVADGLIVHPFTTERYLREVTIPALERGLSKSQRTRSDIQVSYSGMVIASESEKERVLMSEPVRKQLAFYGSTPAYRGVLDLHGWADLQPKLNDLARNGEWSTMANLIDDDVLQAFSVEAPLTNIASRVIERFDGVVDRFSVYPTSNMDDISCQTLVTGFNTQ